MNYVFSIGDIKDDLRCFLVGEVAGKAPYGIVQKEDVNMNMTRVRGTVDSSTDVISDTRNVSPTEKFCLVFVNCPFFHRN